MSIPEDPDLAKLLFAVIKVLEDVFELKAEPLMHPESPMTWRLATSNFAMLVSPRGMSNVNTKFETPKQAWIRVYHRPRGDYMTSLDIDEALWRDDPVIVQIKIVAMQAIVIRELAKAQAEGGNVLGS